VATIEKSIKVDVPVRQAYNQWTQFEEFPKFMDAVQEVRQITDTLVHWTVEIAGVTREFDTEITEQTPDQRIAWKTIDGPHHAGVVTFHRLDDDTTRVTLQMDYDPHGFLETVGDKAGFVSRQIQGDMENFKTLIENRSVSSGAWRGTVD